MTAPTTHRVLITDDEPGIRNDLGDYLTDLGYDVTVAADASEAMAKVSKSNFNVLLLDDMLPDETGLDLLPRLLDTKPGLSIIIMTGYPTVKSVIMAMRRGACDFVIKPFELGELKDAVARAASRSERLNAGSGHVENVIGGNAAVDTPEHEPAR